MSSENPIGHESPSQAERSQSNVKPSLAGAQRAQATWREAGEWWAGEPYREVSQYFDEKGIRREQEILLPCLGAALAGTQDETPYQEDHREEICLRVQKVRDEKVAKACGYVQEATYPHLYVPEKGEPYALLHGLSGYSIGRSCLLAEEIAVVSATKGVPVACIADCFSLSGAAEFVKMARKLGVRPLVGASFELEEGGELVLIAKTRVGFRSLSRLISECHLDEPRLFPLCTWERLEKHTEDVLCLTGGDLGPVNRQLSRGDHEGAKRTLERLVALYGRANVTIEIERSYLPWESAVNNRLLALSEELGTTAVAGGAVTHGIREHFPVQDMLMCVESLCTIDEIVGRKPRRHPDQPQIKLPPARALNAERYLKTPAEMTALFADRPDLLRNSLLLAERCDEDVLPGRTTLPKLFDDDAAALREIVSQGAARYYESIDRRLHNRIEKELRRIISLNFAGHFLVAWDMCNWARSQNILFSGRGSVIDSVVAYCLGFSRIDAFEHKLHFERFLPPDGSKRPDIDIDFEAAKRDDVRNYLANKYGRDKVATVCAVGAYCTRGIVREVGKVMGLPDETISYLTKRLHGGVTADKLEKALDARPELRDSNIPRERFRWVFRLSERLMDIPRNIRSHSSGVVISDQPICDTVPVMQSAVDGVNIIQWDKRSAKLCFDKFDVLCLRGNDVLSGTQERVRKLDESFDVEAVPTDDEETYRAMRSGQLIGIPQSASPAMRQAHIRLRTENLTDASLVQAGIRPGVGGAVKLNELIARRRGKPYAFEHPELERILGNTYGIIVFQEQVDMLLETFCGFTPGGAEDLRDAIYKRRREEYARSVHEMLIQRMLERGYGLNVAEHVYDLVAGFQGYGFAQGHALAFAEISIRSIYCQQNYPAEYFAALLNAQPAGYYGPCTIANEARIRGVRILRPDLNKSTLRFEVEDVKAESDPKIVIPNGGIRISIKQIKGLSKPTATRIAESKPFGSFFDFVARVRPARDELETLILCGFFDSLHPNRRALLWAIPNAMSYATAVEIRPGSLPLWLPEPSLNESMPDFSYMEKALHERNLLELDTDNHLMVFERDRVTKRGGIPGAHVSNLKAGDKAFAVGHPIRLRFPPTASGKRVVFFDLEDESGLLNVTCFDDTYQKDGHAIICSGYVTVVGEAQDRDGHIAFLAHRVFTYHPTLSGSAPQLAALPVTTGDFLAK